MAKVDAGYYHEAADRAFSVQQMIEVLLTGHPVIEADAEH